MQTTLVAEPVVAVQSKRKSSSLLPLLVVLFLISYGLLTLLVVEQDHTITAQRTLISQLYGDSLELTAMKSKEMQRHRMDAGAQTQGQSQAQGQTHSKARVEAQAPSSQEKPQAKIEADSSKVGRRFLQKPKGVEDNPDARRALGRS